MIDIVGCGPGSPDYLTAAAKKVIDAADVLIGAKHLLAMADNDGAERIEVTAHIDKALDDIRAQDEAGRKVAVLVSGDPGVFSLAKRVTETFGTANCNIVPGVSSVQVAFARVGLSWNDALIISAHHELPDIDDPALGTTKKIALLSGRDDVLDWLAGLVAKLGDVAVYACENLTLDDERVAKLTEDDLKTGKFASRCVFLVISK